MGKKDELDEEKNVGRLLENIVRDAMASKASDIHFEPREKDMVIRYRVDGLLRDITTIPQALRGVLIFKIKVSSKLRTDVHFAPQDGRIKFVFDDFEVDTRVSILPTNKGEKVVFRLLSKEGKSFKLEDLGLRGQALEKIERNYRKPHGMIVAAGPTGSGKTSTLYSILKLINSREINIVTVEDPVEYGLEGVNQVQVNTKADLTFANGLRSILRQDPDVIMVGEIRDSETARIGINASMTGHLVLSTIHTNDSVTTIPRFVDMGVEPYLVASTLSLVIAQRLARKLCPQCKQNFAITKDYLKDLKKYRPDIVGYFREKDEIAVAKGCEKCEDSGYKGRIGLFEVLEVTKSIRKLIMAGKDADSLMSKAVDEGLVSILEEGVLRVQEGLTSIDELIRITAVKD